MRRTWYVVGTAGLLAVSSMSGAQPPPAQRPRPLQQNPNLTGRQLPLGQETQGTPPVQKTVGELRSEISRDLGLTFPEARGISTEHGALQHLLLAVERELGEVRKRCNEHSVSTGLRPHQELPQRIPFLTPSGEWSSVRGQIHESFAQGVFALQSLEEKRQRLERGRTALWALMARLDCPPVPRLRVCVECRGFGSSVEFWNNLSGQAEAGPFVCSTCKGRGTRYPEDATPDTGQNASRSTPSVDGVYAHLQARIAVPTDRYRYGDFYFDRYWTGAGDYAGHTNLSAGYWVYAYPFWYIWSEKVASPARRQHAPAAVNGNDRGDRDDIRATEEDLRLLGETTGSPLRERGAEVFPPSSTQPADPAASPSPSTRGRGFTASPSLQGGGFTAGVGERPGGSTEVAAEAVRTEFGEEATVAWLVERDASWDLTSLRERYRITKVVRDRDGAGRAWRIRFFLTLRKDVWDYESVIDGVLLTLALCDEQGQILARVHPTQLKWGDSASGETVLGVLVSDIEDALQHREVRPSEISKLTFVK